MMIITIIGDIRYSCRRYIVFCIIIKIINNTNWRLTGCATATTCTQNGAEYAPCAPGVYNMPLMHVHWCHTATPRSHSRCIARSTKPSKWPFFFSSSKIKTRRNYSDGMWLWRCTFSCALHRRHIHLKNVKRGYKFIHTSVGLLLLFVSFLPFSLTFFSFYWNY